MDNLYKNQSVWRFDCVLLRHGESEDVASGLVSGQRDSHLTPKGKLQARAVAWQLATLGISTVVCSDLARSRDTAVIIAEHLGLPAPRIDPRWRERDWGNWQGQPRTGDIFLEDHEAPLGGESLQMLQERVLSGLQDVPSRTLVVTHAGPIREVLRAIGQEPVSPGLCGWRDIFLEQAARLELSVIAEVIEPGEFAGIVVFVRGAEDLARVNKQSLVLLCECPKAVAVQAVDHAAASVNLMRSLTAHLTHGRISNRPYAVAIEWPEGFPKDGTHVRLNIRPPQIFENRPPLPDIPPIEGKERNTAGGKVAGLLQLQVAGALVPQFHTITIDDIKKWQTTGQVLPAARDWVQKVGLPPGSLWAVRSSADLEDAEGDPLSGSFISILGCSPDEVPDAVEKVAESANGLEVQRRLQTGRLQVAPRMAVTVQRMVHPIKIAGAVFLPAPRDPGAFLLEARWGDSGETLMDGRNHADIRARYDRDGRQIALDISSLPVADHIVAEHLANCVANEALALYLRTGRGDMEFAVDSDNTIWWLQARTLNEPVEVVDRRGFHPAAVAYYKGLAFRVAEANRTDAVYFRCFDLGDGKFGYSVGIRQRDHLFHERVRLRTEHLAEVTSFGWDVERRMAEVESRLNDSNPEEVLSLLTLHGAVQLPFSIPMNTKRMDRFQSRASDGHPARLLLEEFVDTVSVALSGKYTPDKIIGFLLQPRKNLSIVEGLRGLEKVRLAGDHCSEKDLLRAAIPDIRDVPDVSISGIRQLRKEIDQRHYDAFGEGVDCLKDQIEIRLKQMRDRQILRANFLAEARKYLNDDLSNRLQLWADYLEMKAETNETHCIYRGICFTWFSEIGFSPN